jgi:hypothetical protein
MSNSQSWAQYAVAFAKGAERARLAGDNAAFVELGTAAVECLRRARIFEDLERASRGETEAARCSI